MLKSSQQILGGSNCIKITKHKKGIDSDVRKVGKVVKKIQWETVIGLFLIVGRTWSKR